MNDETLKIEDLTPGTTFREVIEWRVVSDRVTGQPFARSDTAPWAKALPAFDLSMIRDVHREDENDA